MAASFRRSRLGVIALVGLGALAACSETSTDPVQPQGNRRNVIVICVDTLRSDHTGAGGYHLETTPNLDRLSARGTRFSRCISTYPQTAASIASIFTSLYPTSHKVRPEDMILSREPTLLAETFRNAGYDTVAIASNPHLTPGLGFERGFERFYYVHGKDVKKSSYADDVDSDSLRDVEVIFRQSEASFYGGADAVNGAALEWLDGRADERPFFLYLHFMDVHSPYKSPRGFQRRFITQKGKNIYRNGIPRRSIGPTDVAFTTALYDGGIGYADHMIGLLLEELASRDLLRDSYIVFVSDHGEEFLEHGGTGHGKTLHRELVDVPLFIVGPDVEAGTVSSIVSTLDVFPTICDLVGLDSPERIQGRSLAPSLRGNEAEGAPRFVLSECDETREGNESDEPVVARYALTGDEWRLVHCPERGTSELYRYTEDTREQDNLAAEHPERVAAMIAEAERLLEIARTLGASIEAGQAVLSDEMRRELNELGYGGE